jgi:endothelin-converting enzyme/putative endopeptidase
MRTLSILLLAATAAFAQKLPGFDPGALNRAINPCDNFYQFACGGWMTANPLPGDQARWGRFDQVQDRNRATLQNILETASSSKNAKRTAIEQKIGDYYAACMDEQAINAKGLAALKPDLDRINAMKTRAEVTDVVTHLFQIGYRPYFNVSSEQDPKDSTQVIAALDQGGLGLPDRDYYFKTDEKSVDLRTKYVEHITRLFQLMGSSEGDAKKKAAAIMALETELAEGSLDRVSRRDPEKVYHKLPLGDVLSLTPEFDWNKFFPAIGTPAIQFVDVAVPPFLRAFNTGVNQRPLDDVKAYLTWNLVRDSAEFLPAEFQNEIFGFFKKTLSGAKEIRPRWKRCVDLTDEQLPDALGFQFVQKTLGEQGKKRAAQMVTAIEKAFERDIRSLDWMTEPTKQQALKKLHAITNKIGDQAKWQDYGSVTIARDDPYGNSGRASQFELRRQMAKIGKPVDKTEWQMSQPTVNAYYDPQANDINFPAGILQPPFWENKMDDAVNFGGIGAVIGHELTHGFDDQGRQYDPEGNLKDWWTEADAKAFEQRAECIVDQYSGYSPLAGVNLNGKLTLGENTADNGGLRISYMALLDTLAGKTPKKIDGFTAEQRFFLGWAQVWCQNTAEEMARLRAQTDPHSPGEFRVNGVVSNMPEFQKAFACRTGQIMVRGPACRVW